MASASRDEDAARIVDPDLLDLGVVEERLERAEAGDTRDQFAHDSTRIGHRDDGAGQAALVVSAYDVLGNAAHDRRVPLGVDTFGAHLLAHPRIELLDEIGMRVRTRQRHE